jgi:epoxyqueuosine reductase QueG
MDLNDKLKTIAETWGADFFGVADLAAAHGAILEQGGPVIAAYPRAISIGMTIPHAIVDQLPQRADRAVAVNYRHHGYDVINQRLELLASLIGGELQRAGHQALPMPASKRVDDERICAAFSHKLAARLAGFGWIGKNCLLVTPEAGPRVRWTTVLTDAPISGMSRPMEDGCGSCRQCVEICPVQAFTGEPFRTAEPREARFDARKCDRYFAWLRKNDPQLAVCGLCLYVCPHGRQRKRESAS